MATHHASCHCGAVRYDVELELEGLATCNCSMCARTGAIMAFVPRAQLQNVAGEDKLTDYQFGKKHIHHAFCSICGAKPFAWGESEGGDAYAMVNVRCIEGIDPHTLTIAKTYDGKSL